MKANPLILNSIYCVAVVALFSLVACNKENNGDQPIVDNDTFKLKYEVGSNFMSINKGDNIQITESYLYLGDTVQGINFEVENVTADSYTMETSIERYYTEGAEDQFCISGGICVPGSGVTQTFPSYKVNAGEKQVLEIHLLPTDTKVSGQYLVRYDFYVTTKSDDKFSVYVIFDYTAD